MERTGGASGNSTVSLSSERSAAAGSALPLIDANGSGQSDTSVRTHRQGRRGVFQSASGHVAAPGERPSRHIPRLFLKHKSVFLKAQCGRCRVKSLRRPQMSALQPSATVPDILLCKAFTSSSVFSSAPALLFPLMGTLQLHEL